MHAKALASRGISGICVLALALLLASCKGPTKPTYTVGGAVSGLSGTGLVLQNNGGNNLANPGNGAFTFSATLNSGAAYRVTVLIQPSGQTCTVANAAGTVSANVTNVSVACVSSGFTVGGTVSGLTGTGLVLRNNGGNDLAVSADGPFTFSTAIAGGGAYSVTVFTQPSGQSCTVANGAGTISANVTNVAVNCVTAAYTIGGAVVGLTGTGLVLQDNGVDDLAISGNGGFTFSTALANGASYSVTVLTQPSGQGCAVANGSGSIAGANVVNVTVSCVAPPAAPTLSLGFGVKELQFSWPAANGATFYRLLENPDGVSGYTQVGANLTALSYNHIIPVHQRLNASYILQACNGGGCTDSFTQDLGTSLAQAIGYFKASNTGTADDRFGFSVALSGDGNTLAVGAPLEDSGSTGINSVPNESASGAGAVYVFSKSAGTWLQQAYVKASNPGIDDAFGYSVALSGDGNTLAVGAPNEDSSSTGINSTPDDLAFAAGAAYVYVRSAGAWSQQAYLKASNTRAINMFGNSVTLSGDGNTLAVGASFESSSSTGINSTPDDLAFAAGAAYVYVRSAGAWSQQAYVKASNTESGDLFGSSVALSGGGNTLAVGATNESSSTNGINSTPNESAPLAGAVYVYTRSAGTWSQQAYVKASNTGEGDSFGSSVTLSGDGDALAVGAPFEASNSTGINSVPNESAPLAGAVYVYARSAGTWSQQAYVKASNSGLGHNFGTSVALSGDGNALAVGAPLEDGSGSGIGSTPDDFAADSGAVYFYKRSAGTWSQQTYVKASNAGAVDEFGTSVALNSDGNTLAVGAAKEDGSSTGVGSTQNDNLTNAGAVYLY
jgi:hypothetical protein